MSDAAWQWAKLIGILLAVKLGASWIAAIIKDWRNMR